MIWAIFLTIAKLLLTGMVVLYAGFVLITYWTEGTGYPAKFDWSDPARSAQRFLVRAGVLVLGRVLRIFRSALDVLEDTSADLGEWLLNHRGGGS